MQKLSFILSALLLLVLNAGAQTTIEGTLKDDSGKPLSGAVIKVKNTSNSVVSDVQGQFKLNHSGSLPVILRITAVGFVSIEQEVTSAGSALSLSLKPDQAVTEIELLLQLLEHIR